MDSSSAERERVIEALRALEPELREKGFESLFLFGSFGRGQVSAASDVDLFCDLSVSSRLGLAFYALRNRIAELVGRPVDLTTREALHPLIREEAVASAIRVF
jgi:predicted nucleotidyltransferase